MSRYIYILKNKNIISIIVVLIIIVIILTGCSSSGKASTYYDTSNNKEYMKLNDDGTYVIYYDNFGEYGKWIDEGNKILLESSWGISTEASINGTTITDPGSRDTFTKH